MELCRRKTFLVKFDILKITVGAFYGMKDFVYKVKRLATNRCQSRNHPSKATSEEVAQSLVPSSSRRRISSHKTPILLFSSSVSPVETVLSWAQRIKTVSFTYPGKESYEFADYPNPALHVSNSQLFSREESNECRRLQSKSTRKIAEKLKIPNTYTKKGQFVRVYLISSTFCDPCEVGLPNRMIICCPIHSSRNKDELHKMT